MLVIPYRIFFKVLSSQSFFKGKRLWVLKSNMADETSYHSYFPAAATSLYAKHTDSNALSCFENYTSISFNKSFIIMFPKGSHTREG